MKSPRRIFFASIGCTGRDGNRGLWARNLVDPLIRIGYEAVESGLDWDELLECVSDGAWISEGRPRRSEQLLEEVRRAHRRKPLDLFVSYFYSVHVEPEAIRQIRKLGIPTVNFFCNAAHQFHLVAEIAPAYDFCWVPEQQAVPYYRSVGANPVHVQMGANPDFCRPIPGVDRDIPVLFVGQLYADRARWLAGLLGQGIPVRIYTGAFGNGDGFSSLARRSLIHEAFQDLQTYGGIYLMRRFCRMVATRRALSQVRAAAEPSPDDDEILHLFARSTAVLNFSHVYDGGVPGGKIKAHVRLRDFEVPMCRALHFPQYSDELALYYDLGKEVVAWKSLDELAAKIRYYLSHPDAAEQVRAAGYRRALADHTWEKRYSELFRAINLNVHTLRQI